ncbi:apolipoprotein N-acyltransferase [Rhodoblastus acidophilus]|uniref:Apolipoprotein N-acyltransferase n=1 Tax=Candidatus Rhodoblastus alkanivorans TaxID=2954117 RepID=A0ABS9Z1F6_9HYPH|nr:apolipoprotein N-acyltransferase [Candidatus Rhodoblastus alkanivorans]MCI4679440.1 apolipoprotein N-acyltransferase [Candidatus Rhodoblastus alkanivorans]MCI4681448.1 apolipoprotein N-acyltransferase [Candidatus Rhodoblastus alkanivorans]MDI4642496.1 apolipoprotein N-acyltransferase [Rhodoblastus acidophilus]
MFALQQYVVLAEGWPRRLVAFCAGAFGALALAPVNFFPALAISMVVSVWLLDGSTASTFGAILRRSASAGWWLGFGYFVVGLWWLGAAFLADGDRFAWALPLGVVGLPVFLAFFTALGFVFARLLWSPSPLRIFALAAGLSASEWLRGSVLTGFPWNDFGMVLGGNLYLAQTASIWGLYGLTVLSVLIFASPALFFQKGRKNVPVGGILFLALLGLFGAVRLSAPERFVKGARLRLIQPDVAIADFRSDRRNQLLEHYLSLSDRATSPDRNGVGDVTHLFWPESSFPFILSQDGGALSLIGSRLQNAILLTGAARAEGEGPRAKYFNSIQVISGGEVKESYDKIHLVPFGEYIPFGDIVSRLGLTQFVDIPGGFSHGRSSRLLTAPGLPPILPLVCYESIFPNEIADRISSQAVRPGVMLNVTNDGWFGKTSGPYQHFEQARLRTIEQGLPMIRVANTGISAILDPFGRATAYAPLGVEAVLDGELPKALPATIYSRHWIILPLILWVAVFFVSLVGRRKV